MNPINKEAYKLLHEGTLCLADIEANGIRINLNHCKKASEDLERKIRILEKRIEILPEMKTWRKIYGAKTNTNSTVQLERILFDELNLLSTKETVKGKRSTDDESLSKLNIPLTRSILNLRLWKKVKTTYLEALTREEVNGFIHPFFGIIGTRTYRGQSDHPNFQNIPIRNKELGKLIRQAIIPRPGQRLVERDYKGIEVSVAQSYNQDQILLYDILNGDMHRDASMKCFMLSKEEMTKDIRYLGKNKWVFPQFYGDWYGSCAKAQWEEVDNPSYNLFNGISLRKHLRSKGIYSIDDFEDHLRQVEDWFWNKKYKRYTEWKKERLTEYWKKGYLDTLTGFQCRGLMDSKQVINYPIQGSAFHCLLWSLIQLNKFLKKYKMKSKIIGQIHDCALTDEHPSESKDISEKSNEIMTIDLKKQYPWITAPMIIETEQTEIDGNWWEKK